MASRVNTKFVIILAGVLLVLFAGVAGLAVYQNMRSGDRLISQGDAAAAQGDFELAAKKYSRAVNKDQSRSDWILKWRDALLKTTPENSAVYQKAYKEQYMGILNMLAALNPTDPQPQIDFVKEFDDYIRLATGGSIAGIQQIATLVDERSAQLDPTDPKTKELLGYRGRAVVDQMLRISVDDSKAQQALKDLEGAIQADPDDVMSAISLVQWYYAQLGEARRDVRSSADAEAEFKKRLDALLAEHGSDPAVRLFAFQVEATEALRNAVTAKDQRQVAESLKPDAQATLDVLAGAASQNAELLNVAARVLPSYIDADAKDQLLQVIQKASDANPSDANLLLLLAQSMAVRQRYSDAYEVFGRVAQLPDQPVSLQGMILPEYRRIAVQDQVDMLLAQYELSADQAQKDEFLKQAKARRDVLESMTDVNTEDELRLRDAQIAFIEGDNKQAVVLLEEIRRNLPADNPRVQRLLAQAQTREGNLGEAARQYEQIVANDQASPVDFAYLGDTYFQLGDTEKALAAYRRALQLNPDYEVAKRRIDAIMQATGQAQEGSLLDPVIAALMQAQKLGNDGDPEGAIQVLADAHAKAPSDYRLIRELAARYVAADRRPEAKALVADAIKANPDSTDLKALQQQVTIEDPVKAGEAIIDSLDSLTPVQKAIQRFYLYSGNGQPEKANAAFAEAERLNPNDPAVIEIGFLLALSKGDDGLEDASRYAARAAEQNADRIGGLTYKGRLELARGNTREAEATFQRAVERMPFDPMSWRWLGQAQSQNGKVDVALASFERAYQGRPTHVGIAEDYARALVSGGQGAKALGIIQKAVAESRTPRVIMLWLDLEAEYGDRDMAMENRRKLFAQKPDGWSDAEYLANGAAYLNELIADKDFTAFEEAVTKAEQGDMFSPLQIVSLRARALAESGNVEGGRTLLTDYLKALPDDQVTVDSWMSLGRFEREFGTIDDSIAAYERAKPYQSAEFREADRALGDLHFSAGQAVLIQSVGDPASRERAKDAREHFQKAADSYEAVHAASPDDASVSKRLAEDYIRLDRYEDALSAISAVGNDDDLQVLLLRSMVAQARSDTRAARTYMDRAVAQYPNDPIPYFRRADLNKTDEALFPDVIADLDQATKLRPGFVDAWALRFELYRRHDRMDEAFAQLRSAIAANPDSDELKRTLIGNLRAYGRMDEARAEVQKIADANWDNREWIEQAALISYSQGKFDDAKRYYQRLYELDPKPLAAADLLNAWFRAESKPSRPDVNRLLRNVYEADLTDARLRTQIVTLMLEARCEHWLGETKKADDLTLQAYKKANESNAIDLQVWFEDLVERYHTADSSGRKEAFAFLKNHASELGELKPILQILVIRDDMLGGAPLAECATRFEALQDKLGDDPYNKLEYARLENQVYYSQGRYEDCAAACRAGLAILPTDLELNNNLAYVLAKHLKQPEDALPYAQAAAEAAPLNAAVLDTLGWVYFESGRFRDADQVLRRAITTATGPDELVPAYLHLAQTKKATGDLEEAKKYVMQAKDQVGKASQTIKEQYGQDITALSTELTSP